MPRPLQVICFVALLATAVQAPALAQTAAPSSPPTATPAPPPTPSPGGAPSTREPFGVEATLPAKTIIYMKGNGSWDTALETLQDAFKSVYAYLDKQGIARAGSPMTIYTDFDDSNFTFQAAVPVAEAPKDTPKGDIAVGQAPVGKAVQFVYRGSFHQMEDTIYNAIPEYLDEKQLEPTGTFVEEYRLRSGDNSGGQVRHPDFGDAQVAATDASGRRVSNARRMA